MAFSRQTSESGTSPEVSIIVPARNEEDVVGECLDSLLAQTGTTFEILVADDGSTDRTRQMVEQRKVFVVDPGPVPVGWTGKSNAIHKAAGLARGEWLLFTDADTMHAAGSLRLALGEAEEHAVALLSYSPTQIVRGFCQRALMPVIFAELVAQYPPSQINDPCTAAAAANGQFMLIRSDVYRKIGGHAKVAGSLLEDVALARIVKESGHKIRFRASAAVSTRMYRNFPAMWEGWTKNLALLFPQTRALAARRAGEFLWIVGSLLLAVYSGLRGNIYVSALCFVMFGASYASFYRRVARAHFKVGDNLLSLLGLPILVLLLLRSYIYYDSKGTVSWKGRNYPVGSAMRRTASADEIDAPRSVDARRGCENPLRDPECSKGT